MGPVDRQRLLSRLLLRHFDRVDKPVEHRRVLDDDPDLVDRLGSLLRCDLPKSLKECVGEGPVLVLRCALVDETGHGEAARHHDSCLAQDILYLLLKLVLRWSSPFDALHLDAMQKRLALEFADFVGLDEASLGQRLVAALIHDVATVIDDILTSCGDELLAWGVGERQRVVIEVHDHFGLVPREITVNEFASDVVHSSGIHCLVVLWRFKFVSVHGVDAGVKLGLQYALRVCFNQLLIAWEEISTHHNGGISIESLWSER